MLESVLMTRIDVKGSATTGTTQRLGGLRSCPSTRGVAFTASASHFVLI